MKFALVTLSGAIFTGAGVIAESIARKWTYDCGFIIGFGVLLSLIGLAGCIVFEILYYKKDKF